MYFCDIKKHNNEKQQFSNDFWFYKSLNSATFWDWSETGEDLYSNLTQIRRLLSKTCTLCIKKYFLLQFSKSTQDPALDFLFDFRLRLMIVYLSRTKEIIIVNKFKTVIFLLLQPEINPEFDPGLEYFKKPVFWPVQNLFFSSTIEYSNLIPSFKPVSSLRVAVHKLGNSFRGGSSQKSTRLELLFLLARTWLGSS